MAGPRTWRSDRGDAARAQPRAQTLPDWPGHKPGQHVDVRLTGEDGYQRAAQLFDRVGAGSGQGDADGGADRGRRGVALSLHRGAQGDQFELRGPIGGHFVWTSALGGPLFLIAGGSGVAPLMAMLRHRAAANSKVPATLLYSSRRFEDIIYRAELERLAAAERRLENREYADAQAAGRLDKAARAASTAPCWKSEGFPPAREAAHLHLRPDATGRDRRADHARSRTRPDLDQDRTLWPDRRLTCACDTTPRSTAMPPADCSANSSPSTSRRRALICEGCEAEGEIAQTRVYGGSMGALLRCAHCDAVMIRLTHTPRGFFLDMRGARRMFVRASA